MRDPYPTRPHRPAVLNKLVGQLTDDELVSLPKIKADFNEAMAAYEKECQEWTAKERIRSEAEIAKIHENAGYDSNDPIHKLIEGYVYTEHHSEMSTYAYHLGELIQLSDQIVTLVTARLKAQERHTEAKKTSKGGRRPKSK